MELKRKVKLIIVLLQPVVQLQILLSEISLLKTVILFLHHHSSNLFVTTNQTSRGRPI